MRQKAKAVTENIFFYNRLEFIETLTDFAITPVI